MAVKKKNIPNEEIPAETTAEIITMPEKPVKKVRNFLRQEWEEVVPVAPPPPPTQEADSGPEILLIDDDAPPDDAPDNPIDELLKEIGNAADDHKAVVYELPNYHLDGNSSIAHAETVFCGAVSIPPHFRTKGELLQLIQEKYAKPNKEFYDFSIVVKSRRIKRVLPVVRIRPLFAEPKPTEAGGPNLPFAANAADPLEALEKQAKVFERLRRIIAPEQKAETTIPAGQPLTTEAAILKLISDDPEKVAAIANKFIGGNEKADAMPAWLSALLPVVAPLLTSLAQRLMQPPQESPAVAPPPAVVAAPTPPQEPPFAAKYRYLIGRILYGIENDFSADFIGEEIAIECDKDAALDAAFSGLVGTPTIQLKAQLASLSPESAKVTSRDNCDKFLSDLQIYLAGESESADEK